MNDNFLKSNVKAANKELYDAVGSDYEKIDGRRSDDLLLWLRGVLKSVLGMSCGNQRILDIGCGSGFVLRAAEGLFETAYGMDISRNILKSAEQYADGVICADAEFIPFKNDSMDVVTLFAAMHHFYEHKGIIEEIYRILKKNGVLYIDHDINREFVKKYGIFLRAYRNMFKGGGKYVDAGVDGRVY